MKNIDTGSVTMQRKLSQSACQRGADWGVDRDGIWVDKGCRAVFAYKVPIRWRQLVLEQAGPVRHDPV